jgi:hypothetical protein
MTIFDLHEATLSDYRDFARSFFLIADERARAFVQRALEGEAGSAVLSSSEQAAWAPAVASPGYLLATRTGYAYCVLVIRTPVR